MTLYITGDVHGEARDLAARAHVVGAGEGDEILVLGDVGLIYGKQPTGVPHLASPRIAELAREAPWRLVVMRGNHDARYERDLLDLAWGPRLGFGEAHEVEWRGSRAFTCDELPGAVFLPDAGGAYEIGGVKTLVAPGAYSVDKWVRIDMGWPWEREEQLTPDELERLVEIAGREHPEVVLSHTCPLSWFDWLDDLLLPDAESDNSMERAFDELLDAARPGLRRWCFGHFHDDREVADGLGRLMFRDIVDFGSLVADGA